MAEIIFFDDWDDFVRIEQRNRRIADSKVRPVQAKIKPGHYFINYAHDLGIPIFGEVLDVSKLGHDPEEQKYIDWSYSQLHMKNYRPTRCFSVYCPEGELGDIHLSVVSAVIGPELFEFYKENGWTKPDR